MPLAGGLVGFAAYDVVRYLRAAAGCTRTRASEAPDAALRRAESLAGVRSPDARHRAAACRHRGRAPDRCAAKSIARAARRRCRRAACAAIRSFGDLGYRWRARTTWPACGARRKYIAAGDVYQLVLASPLLEARMTWIPSRCIARCASSIPLLTCTTARSVACTVVGSSPEALVKLNGGRARAAADRRHAAAHGRTPADDRANERRLLADPKENAEHVMLVDLARNDLGRVARAGTVRVNPYRVDRALQPRDAHRQRRARRAGRRAAMPSICSRRRFRPARWSGAPKVRAMQIIDELEPVQPRAVRRHGRLLRRARRHGPGHHHPHAGVPTATNTATRRAPASSPTACPRPSTTKCSPRAPRCARAGNWRRRGCETLGCCLIDNYDSFTYNLVQAFLVLGADVQRAPQRRDHRRSRRCALAPSHLCISPGPGTPHDAGVSMDMIRAFAGQHAGVRRVPGAPVDRRSVRRQGGARRALMHGKTSPVQHDGRTLFAGPAAAAARSGAITR